MKYSLLFLLLFGSFATAQDKILRIDLNNKETGFSMWINELDFEIEGTPPPEITVSVNLSNGSLHFSSEKVVESMISIHHNSNFPHVKILFGGGPRDNNINIHLPKGMKATINSHQP